MKIELFYERLSRLYSPQESLIVRVDSGMAAETFAKLRQGMVGCRKDGKKQVKYTVAYDRAGLLSSIT